MEQATILAQTGEARDSLTLECGLALLGAFVALQYRMTLTELSVTIDSAKNS